MATGSDKPIIWGAAAVVIAGGTALYLYAHRARRSGTSGIGPAGDQRA